MPDFRPWTDRLPALLAEVESSSAPVWFNADLQKLLGLGRRQVTRLMRRWGAELYAHDFELSKAALLAGLQEAARRSTPAASGRPAEWILRVPGALERIEAAPEGTIFRVRDLAALFRMSRARAAELAPDWGADWVGRRLEVTRERLLEGLRVAVEPRRLEAEITRRRKLQGGLAAERLLVPLGRGHRTIRRFERLPSNVRLSPGRLEITGSPKEIVAGLVAVAEALQADPQGFERTQKGWAEALVPQAALQVERAQGERRTPLDLGKAARRVLGPTGQE